MHASCGLPFAICVQGSGALSRSCVEEKSSVVFSLCYIFGTLAVRSGGRHVCATVCVTSLFLVVLVVVQVCMGRRPWAVGHCLRGRTRRVETWLAGG